MNMIGHHYPGAKLKFEVSAPDLENFDQRFCRSRLAKPLRPGGSSVQNPVTAHEFGTVSAQQISDRADG